MSTEAERTPDEAKIDAATIGHQARLIDRLSTQLRDSTKAVVQKDAAIAELLAALRAAGGQEKPVCPLTEAGIEHRPHHYLTPVPWDCPGLPAAPVGGQHQNQDGKTHQCPPDNCRECAYEDGAYL